MLLINPVGSPQIIVDEADFYMASQKGAGNTEIRTTANQSFFVTDSVDDLKAQAFLNQVVVLTDKKDATIKRLIYTHQIAKITAIQGGTGSVLQFKTVQQQIQVVETMAQIMAQYASGSGLGLPYTGVNGIRVVGSNIRLGINPLDIDTEIPLSTYELLMGALSARAASVAISETPAAPIASALLNVESTTKGILIPRMTSAERTSIAGGTPADGLQVYDTDTNSIWWYNGNLAQWFQAVSKEYVDNSLLSIMRLVGAIDASANPNYPAATQGDSYYISVAGKLGGASGVDVQVGDYAVCVVTSISGDQAAVGANWIVLEDNSGQATTVILGLVRLATAAEARAKIVTDKAVTPSALTDYQIKPRRALMTMRNASGTTFGAPLNTWTKVLNNLGDNVLSPDSSSDFTIPSPNRLQYNGANPITIRIRFAFTERRIGSPTPTGSVGIAVSGATGIGSVLDLNRVNAIAFNQGTGELGYSKEYSEITLTTGQYLEFYMRNESTAGSPTMIFGNYSLYIEEVI